MMSTLDIGYHRRARVWSGELPDATYPCTRKVTHTILVGGALAGGPTLAAAEVLVPRGPRALYGLLGGRWRPASNSHLTVEVFLSSAKQRRFLDSLANGIDEVRVGLPEEYLDGVLDGIDLAKGELNDLPPGKLNIDCAAHGAVGSSTGIYKYLAVALVKILSMHSAPSDKELADLFPSTFS